ncbi:MAG: ABC transporter permease [Rikenellaceae bacterium]|nr:ABC transporter permease [Rikenellaceae bacterium]
MSRFRTEYFLAGRLASSGGGRRNGVMTRIAMLSVALGMAVMIVALAVIAGFKGEITAKLVGFGAHVQVVHLDGNNSYETSPIRLDQPFLAGLPAIPDFKEVHPYAIKGGIIRTDEAMQGVVLKGVDAGYDWDFFREHLAEGDLPRIGDTVRHKDLLISASLARGLRLGTGDRVEMLFIREGAMPRRDLFKVSGIYDTGFDELDRVAVMTDLRNVQRLNGWSPDEVSGFEITTTRFDRLDRFADDVFGLVVDSQADDGESLMTVSVRQRYPNIFDWLGAHDVNAAVVITVMLLVALFNMITALLIILLERTSMIGVLKTLGMTNRAIQRIFVIRSAYIIGRGLLWGNVTGIGLALLQRYTGLLRLDPASYFLAAVPIRIDWWQLVALNAATFALILALLTLPTLIVSRIRPGTSVRYE